MRLQLLFVLVTPCAKEPSIGWIDNYMGAMGLTAGMLNGFIKFLPCSGNKRTNFVPADFTVNALITSAWDVSTRSSNCAHV